MHPAHLQSFSTLCLVCVSPFSTSADDWHLSGLFLAIVETSSGFRSSCYWTDRNRANTENIRIGLVFVVLAQWKFVYCIDRFDDIKANKSWLINNIVLLRDVFLIGPRPAVLAWAADRGPITRPIWKTSRNDTFINKPVQYLSGLFLANVVTSSGFRSSLNRANTENIRIGLVLSYWPNESFCIVLTDLII